MISSLFGSAHFIMFGERVAPVASERRRCRFDNAVAFGVAIARPEMQGNPIIDEGICDPHIRVFDGRAYLYATHDASPDNKYFQMHDWCVLSSPDLVSWTYECTLKPKDTYIGKPFDQCWATDCMHAHGGQLLSDVSHCRPDTIATSRTHLPALTSFSAVSPSWTGWEHPP